MNKNKIDFIFFFQIIFIKMNLLELFSGTHSIGYVASSMGYNVISVDRDLDAKSKTRKPLEKRNKDFYERYLK